MNREAWDRFQEAREHYEGYGFNYVNVPWTVHAHISNITKPEGQKNFHVQDKVLVGSAEQSFLSLYSSMDNELYYAITPCFRDEPENNDFTKDYFMKLELFSKNTNNFMKLFNSAYHFFLNKVPYPNLLTFKEEDMGLDIVYNGIEIGSYYNAIRGEYKYVCGTGLAEPRFSNLIRR